MNMVLHLILLMMKRTINWSHDLDSIDQILSNNRQQYNEDKNYTVIIEQTRDVIFDPAKCYF